MTKPQQSQYVAAGKELQRQHDASPATVIAKHKAFFEQRLPMIQRWVTGGVKPEALVRFLLLDLQGSPKLQQCSQESLYLSLLACAAVGLEPGSLRGEAYIVPFAGKAQFMPGYRGLIKLAKRTREVVGLTANVVHERDVFELDLGTANSIRHEPARGDRGAVIGAYAIATSKDGHHELEWMDADDLARVRAVAESRGKSPAWQAWPTEMQRKSVLRRLCKRLPLGPEYFTALALEDAASPAEQRAIIDIQTPAEAVGTLPAAEPEMAEDERKAIEAEEAGQA